jgi:hypothetical protein
MIKSCERDVRYDIDASEVDVDRVYWPSLVKGKREL